MAKKKGGTSAIGGGMIIRQTKKERKQMQRGDYHREFQRGKHILVSGPKKI